MNEKEQLLYDIAHLETVNDQLFTELSEINRLLKMSGFPLGLESLKQTAEEILEGEKETDEE
ncbi:MAG: hypothetical protein Tsb0021_13030 [Chlamydiales bacterium]